MPGCISAGSALDLSWCLGGLLPSELRHRFYCQPWYEPNSKYSDALLSEVDRANLALIRKAEKQSEASP